MKWQTSLQRKIDQALMSELADEVVLEATAEKRVGSSPTEGTTYYQDVFTD